MPSVPLLNILDYQVIDLSITPFERFNPGASSRGDISCTFSVGPDETEPRRFNLYLQCKFEASKEDHNLPYLATISLQGQFISRLPVVTAGVPVTAVNNALILLYGTARGIIGQVTASGINGKFVLPAVTFDGLIARALGDPTSKVLPDDAWQRTQTLATQAETIVDAPQR